MDQEVTAAGDYLRSLYNTITETSWTSFILDRNQSIVFSATLTLILSFLWCVSLTGMWIWTVEDQITIGMTMFCSSFFFSNTKYCHILPGESLTCPPNFQGVTCYSWYSYEPGGVPSTIIGMQVCGLAGTLTSIACTIVTFYTYATSPIMLILFGL